MPPPHQLDSCRNTSLIVYTCCSCVSHHKLAKNQGGHFVTATMHGMAYTCMTGLSLRQLSPAGEESQDQEEALTPPDRAGARRPADV